MAKDREDKEERLKKARETDKKEEKVKKEAVFRLHAAAKKQDEILEDTRITRLAITIDDEDEKITIDDLPPIDNLPPLSIAPAALGGRSKRARAGTIDYRAFTELSRTKEEIERLNQKAERKKKAKAAEIALRSPIKKKSRFVDTKAFERK
jgi:chromosome segregation ATPase